MSSIEFRLLKQGTKQNAQNQNSHTQGSTKARTEPKAQECTEPLFYDSALLYELFPHCAHLDSVSIATLLASTRVVGMRVPGLHSIYSSLELARVNSSFTNGHSACGDFLASASLHSLRRMSNTPHSFSSHSPKNSSAILECQGESLPKDSENISESTLSDSYSVIASAALQSTESNPHTSLESKADSESTSGGVYLHRDKNEIARSANLEASSGRGDCQGGRERPRNSSPSPLDEKETTIEEVKKISEVKAKDSEKVDSESRGQANRDISPTAQYDNNSESETQAKSTKVPDSEKLESRTAQCQKSAQKPLLRYTHTTHPLLNLTTIRISAPMQGIIKAFIRPQRLTNASLNALHTEHKSTLDSKPFKAQRALVIGASSGLGNACAKLLYLGGAQVCATSHSTPFDEPLITSLSLNALKPSNESLQALARFAPTHLYYFATPKIRATQGISKLDLSAYLNAYIFAPLRLLELLKPVAFFQPSSVFVEELPLEFASYSIAKVAMEHFSASLRRLGYHTATPRLPKVATNQTLSLIPQKLASPADSILCELLVFANETSSKEK